MQVYLIRHTSPEIARGICYGQSDIPLRQDLFIEESKIIRSKIPADIDAFYTSPLTRCTELTKTLSNDLIKDERLKELNFGDWELKKWNDLNQDVLNNWMQDFVNNETPNGENYVDLHQRTADFVEELLQKEHEVVAVITHGGNIRSFISWVLGLSLENSFRIELTYGAVVHLSIHPNNYLNKLISINN